ncbi:MAG: D-alanyl-D-alanine carboxypeptidase [Planctomycetes bacterium]|nr:D-alanyl-D-alanine carboxypeptidase [Planctomycetota bacterium]
MKRFLLIMLLFCLVFAGCTTAHTAVITTFVPAEGKQPADSLTGPPLVTAKSWAIADGDTGEILWEYKGYEMRKIASTNKIMTAYIICDMAREDPTILDEIITVTELAGNTRGSSSRIDPGDTVTVGELLYGLMLPSGNDAGNALAEHFNDRFAKPEPGDPVYYGPLEGDSRQNFIAEMTRKARSIGMNNTFYRSPYNDQNDLDASGRTIPRVDISNSFTTHAVDLCRLAFNARKNPLFRKIVSTRQLTSTLTGPNGTPRDANWRNTNRLLQIEGFDGVKTGTTGAAGACLVSHGSRGDHNIYVVVLGSAVSDGRYVDARNLYRWAWLQLGYTN